MNNLSSPGIAAIFSLVIPGAGQIYNGKFLRALFWFIVTPGLWIGSGGTLGWICHLISSYTAYSWAKWEEEQAQARPVRGADSRGEGERTE